MVNLDELKKELEGKTDSEITEILCSMFFPEWDPEKTIHDQDTKNQVAKLVLSRYQDPEQPPIMDIPTLILVHCTGDVVVEAKKLLGLILDKKWS